MCICKPIDLEKIKQNIENALDSETKESLTNWLMSKRQPKEAARESLKDIRLSFWFMRDNHTFVELKGTNIFEVMSDATKISKLNPYGVVCPVSIIEGEKENRMGVMASVDGEGKVNLDEWYNAIKDKSIIKNFDQWNR